MSFIFDREPPSCFSSRVSKVRRSNVIENVKLQRQIEAIELERSYRRYQIHQEKKDLEKHLTKLKEIKELPRIVGRRFAYSCQEKTNTSVFMESNACGSETVIGKARSFSAPSSLPSLTCRCAVTGYKIRTRKLSRENSSASLPVTKEEFDGNVIAISEEEFDHNVGVMELRDAEMPLMGRTTCRKTSSNT